MLRLIKERASEQAPRKILHGKMPDGKILKVT